MTARIVAAPKKRENPSEALSAPACIRSNHRPIVSSSGLRSGVANGLDERPITHKRRSRPSSGAALRCDSWQPIELTTFFVSGMA